MVACYEDQRLIRMLIVEFHCFCDCIIKRYRIRNCRTCIVGMTCPVDFSAFYHHKEACLVVKHLDSF